MQDRRRRPGQGVSVVRNELERAENQPDVVLEDHMLAAAYQWHNYGKATIGAKSDIERVPVESLRAFYHRYYQPDNAILVVAGKFEPARALELVARYFGAIPRPARKLAPTWTIEPVQDGEREVVVRRNGDVAIVGLVYHGVAGANPDKVAEDAIVDILTNKPSGRLYRALVDKGLASEVSGNSYPMAEPGVMIFSAKVGKSGSVEQVRDIMTKTVESLGEAPITKDEIERWRAGFMRDLDLTLADTAKTGVVLSEFAAMGDWRLLFLTRDRVKTTTASDVARVAAQYLKRSNRTLGLFLPTRKPNRAPLPPAPDVAAMVGLPRLGHGRGRRSLRRHRGQHRKPHQPRDPAGWPQAGHAAQEDQGRSGSPRAHHPLWQRSRFAWQGRGGGYVA